MSVTSAVDDAISLAIQGEKSVVLNFLPDEINDRSFMQKRQVRHAETVMSFSSKCRHRNLEVDGKVEKLCNNLRLTLLLGKEDSENVLTSLRCSGDLPDGGLVGNELEDIAAGRAGRGGEHTLRRMRIERRIGELNSSLGSLQQMSADRLRSIDECCQQIRLAEEERKQYLQAELSELLQQLTKVAFTTQENNASIIEKLTVNINKSLIDNASHVGELVYLLKQRELEYQAKVEKDFVAAYNKIVAAVLAHVKESSKQLFNTGRFRNPPHREQLLEEIQREYKSISQFLNIQVKGIDALAVSLSVIKEGQMIGGTHPGGWLHDPENAVDVVKDWEESIKLTGKRLSILNESFIKRAREMELQLQQLATNETSIVREDIKLLLSLNIDDETVRNELYSFYYESNRNKINAVKQQREADLQAAIAEWAETQKKGKKGDKKQEKSMAKVDLNSSLSSTMSRTVRLGDVEVPQDALPQELRDLIDLPEPTLPTYEQYVDQESTAFVENELQVLLNEIQEEGQFFSEILSDILRKRQEEIGLLLISESYSLIPIYRHAALFLQFCYTQPTKWEEGILTKVDEKTKSFESAHSGSEGELLRIIQLIRGSEDAAECRRLGEQGFRILEMISLLYVSSCQERLDLLPHYNDQVISGLGSLRSGLSKSFHIAPLPEVIAEEESFLKRLEDKYQVDLAELEERKLNPATKKSKSDDKKPTGKGKKADSPDIRTLTEEEELSVLQEEFEEQRDSYEDARPSKTKPRVVSKRGNVYVEMRAVNFVDFSLSGVVDTSRPAPGGINVQNVEKVEEEKVSSRSTTKDKNQKEKEPKKEAVKEKPKPELKGKKKVLMEEVTEDQLKQLEEERQRRLANEREEKRRVKVKKYLNSLVAPKLSSGCLIQEELVFNIYRTIRQCMIDWLEHLSDVYTIRCTTYVSNKQLELTQWKSVKLREHQRRPPDFESGVLMARDIELQSITEDLEKQKQFLKSRVENIKKNIQGDIEGKDITYNEKIDGLKDRREKVVLIPTVAQLEVTFRDTETIVEHIRAMVNKDYVLLCKKLEEFMQSFNNEGERVLTVKHHLLEGRADKYADHSLEIIRQVLHEGNEQLTLLKASLHTRREAQFEVLDKQRQLYEKTYEDNKQDLLFVYALQDQMTQIRSKVSHLISKSTEAEGNLRGLLERLESLLGEGSKRADMGGYVAATTTPALKLNGTEFLPEVTFPVLDNVDMYPEELESQLRKNSILQTQTLRSCNANAILTILDQIRQAFYTRGLFLNALKFRIDMKYLSPESYILPPSSKYYSQEGQSPPGSAPPSKLDNKSATKTATKTSPQPPGTPADQPQNTLEALGKTVKAEALLASIIQQGMAVYTPIVQKYYQQLAASKRPITRMSLIPDEEGECNKRITEKLQSFTTLLNQHVDKGQQEYRKQCQKLFILSYKVPLEVLVGVYNLGMGDIKQCGLTVRKAFQYCYNDLMRAREKNNSSIKGSQSNPASKHAVVSTRARELNRNASSLHLLLVFNTFAIREEHQGFIRLWRKLMQTCETLAVMLSQLVSLNLLTASPIPAQVAGSEGEDHAQTAGHHKSLKRLLKAKQKEESHVLFMQSLDPQPELKGKKDDKSKKSTGPLPTKAGAKLAAKPDEEVLQIVDIPMTMYNGLPIDCFTNLQRLLERIGPDLGTAGAKYFGYSPQQAPAEAQTADKKKPIPKQDKGKTAGTKTASDAGAPAPAAPVPSFFDQLVSVPLVAPNDQLTQACVRDRNNMFEAARAFHEKQCSTLNAFHSTIWEEERAWKNSFEDMIGALVPSLS